MGFRVSGFRVWDLSCRRPCRFLADVIPPKTPEVFRATGRST